VDADTSAFNQIMTAFALPKSTEEEKVIRQKTIQEATRVAIEVPFSVMKTAHAAMQVIRAMAETGNPNSISDAGVGALCARAAVSGAFLNVRINASNYADPNFVSAIISEGNELETQAIAMEREILQIVDAKIGI